MEAFLFAQSDDDFYAPPGAISRRGVEYRPARVPDGWTGTRQDIWTQWYTGDRLGGVEDGWKVHISARPDQATEVLDDAAAVLFAHRVPFKHLSCSRFFLLTGHKHAARQQAGKFIAAYPPDQATARRLLQALAEALADREGPFVLTDRRYGPSSVVHYRYGAFVPRQRVRADGHAELLVRDGTGRLVPDRRGTRFVLPDGITDPFTPAPAPAPAPASVTAPVTPPATATPDLGGYRFERAIRHSNGGGTYQGRALATGRTVFIKEARAHTGLTSMTSAAPQRLRREYATLCALHERYPGCCPEPLDYFQEWEHEFLVTEFVPGRSLHAWMVEHNPLIRPVATPSDFAAYYERAQRVVDALDVILQRLHDAGYAFIDVNPHNVLVDDDDRPRLVDFEAAGPLDGPLEPIGAPGYFAPADLVGDNPLGYDEFGLSSLALGLIAPLNCTADRNPAVLRHLRHELAGRARVPRRLWRIATRFRAPRPDAAPTPQAVAADPVPHLESLRDGLLRGLLAAADPDRADRVFPIGPSGYLTNALCVAHGLAGILHALRRCGATPPDGTVAHLATRSLARLDELPPGLHVGTAGIAWVLADHGRLDEAQALLDNADRHPALESSATLGHGRAGVALAELALYRHSGDERYLDRALAQADRIGGLDDGDLDDTVGLLSGRAGIALLYHRLAALTGHSGQLRRGLGYLHGELDRAVTSDGGLLFPVSGRDGRLMPYLFAGSAGVGLVASRYLATAHDERLAAALPALLAGVRCPYTFYGGLYNGMAGLGLFLEDHGRRHGDADATRAAYDIGRRMYLYAIPGASGTHILGEHDLRRSCDLYSGSAGALLFLDQLLRPREDAFFTLDAPDTVPAKENPRATVDRGAVPHRHPVVPTTGVGIGDHARSPKVPIALRRPS